MLNISTTLKQLERWVAPKEIQKSGFGKLKIEGQEVTVCTKTAADMHKIGEQLHRLSNLNKTQGKQDWEGNKAIVRELEGQIHELGATLEGMKLASSQLKTRGDIKAAIKFTKEIDAKAVQIKNAIEIIITKVDQKTQIDLLKVTQALCNTTDINGEARADLNEMKVSRHVKPQSPGFSLLTVFQAFGEFPAIEALIQTLFQKLDTEAQNLLGTSLKTHLNNHYTAVKDSFLKIKEVSTNITSSTEADELLRRVQEARGRVIDLTGAAKAILTLSFFVDDRETALIPTNLDVIGKSLETREAMLEQKRDLFKHLETLAPLQAALDETHKFDLSTIGLLFVKITDLKNDIFDPKEVDPENRKVYENLANQIQNLEAKAERRLARFGGITIASHEPTGEKILHHEVTVAHLTQASQRLENRLLKVTQYLEKKPGRAQHQLAALTKDLERLVELQQYISGEKAELITYRDSIQKLGISLKQCQIKAEGALEIEATRLKGLGKGLTVVFQELTRIAADHLTPETERLKEIKAQRNVAIGIAKNLENSAIQSSSPNYSQNKAELSQARQAIAMANALTSSFKEKIVLNDIQKGLLEFEKGMVPQPLAKEETPSTAALLEQKEKLSAELDQVGELARVLKEQMPAKESPNFDFYSQIKEKIDNLDIELSKNYNKNQIKILFDTLNSLNKQIESELLAADSETIENWQAELQEAEASLNSILSQLAEGEEKYVASKRTAFDTTAADLKILLADRRIIVDTRDRLAQVKELLAAKVTNDESSSFGDRLGLLNHYIKISIPHMQASMTEVSAANQQGTRNFDDYVQLTNDIDDTLENLTKIQMGYADSPRFFPALEKYGAQVQKKIIAEIEAIGADLTLPVDKKFQKLDHYRNEVIPGFEQILESGTTFLPKGGELNALNRKNADRVNELNITIDHQIEIIADRAAIMTAARNDMAVVQVFSEGIADVVENPEEEIWKFERSFDEERANETFTQLQQALQRLHVQQKALGVDSIEGQEIDHRLEHGEILSARYLPSVESKTRKEVETIFKGSINGMRKQLDYIRLSTSDSTLEKTIVSLGKLSKETSELMKVLEKAKFPFKNEKKELIDFNGELGRDYYKLNRLIDYKKTISKIKLRLNTESIFTTKTSDKNLHLERKKELDTIYKQLQNLKEEFDKEPLPLPGDPYTALIEGFNIPFMEQYDLVEKRVLRLN